MTAVYGAGTINGADGRPPRRRATRAEMAERPDVLFEIVREQQPTSIRFVYYVATTRGLVPKTEDGYRRVQRAILAMRREGRLPWGWIVDNTRWMRKPTTWGSIDQMLADAAACYRRARWHDAPTLVEVRCESEAVAGVVYPVTDRWDVPLFPIHGQTSETFAYGAAMTYRDDPRNIQIYYLGDHDPHGYEISSQLEAKLREHSGRTDIDFCRLACTADDVHHYDLPGDPAKKDHYVDAMTGQRVPWVGKAVQIEALDPRLLSDWADRLAGGAA